MRMFTVDSSNKYMLKIEEINNIEDAGEDFTTEDELREMLGVAEDQYFHVNEEMHNTELIKQEVASWVAKIPQGKKSIVCTDELLIEAIKDATSYGCTLSSFAPNLRRLGNKFVIHDAKNERKTNKNDFARLINLMLWSINRKKKYTLDLKYSADDRSGSLELLKKLISWDEINWAGANVSDEDKEHMRKIWDNPTMFDKVEGNPDLVD